MCGGTQRTSQRSGVKHSKRAATSWRQRPDGVQSPVSTKPVYYKGEVVGSIKKYFG